MMKKRHRSTTPVNMNFNGAPEHSKGSASINVDIKGFQGLNRVKNKNEPSMELLERLATGK
jgi:hypothetical protein